MASNPSPSTRISPLMPPPPTPAPASASVSVSSSDDRQFPPGQCRYILVQPELKGQRCGCVCFTHNALLPGASCECGHLACYHMAASDVPSPGKNYDAIEGVKRRVSSLEQQVEAGRDHRDINSVVVRLSQLEDTADKNREELQNQVKASYRNIAAAWQLIEQLQNRVAACEDTHRAHNEEMHNFRNRNLELLETDEMLEERIEKLEGMDTLPSPAQEPTTSNVLPMSNLDAGGLCVPSRRISTTSRPKSFPFLADSDPLVQMHPGRAGGVSSTLSGAWTIHVSILPSQAQSSPFEKDSVAYKRCLSRGLQQMVAVEGSSGACFVAAVSKAFEHVLKDAQWEPMSIKPSKTDSFEELPALRPLESSLSPYDYSREFLRENCAACDGKGRMQAIYLAITDGSFSWPKLRSLPVYIHGLESSWKSEESLDLPKIEDEKSSSLAEPDYGQQEALLTNGLQYRTLPTLKRSASEAQPSGIPTKGPIKLETEESRVKRKCMPDMIKIR